jgi:hypothetical protein
MSQWVALTFCALELDWLWRQIQICSYVRIIPAPYMRVNTVDHTLAEMSFDVGSGPNELARLDFTATGFLLCKIFDLMAYLCFLINAHDKKELQP